jgi:hypothetical protein
MLARRGVHVIFGATAGREVSFNASKFYLAGNALLYGLILFKELDLMPPGTGAFISGLFLAEQFELSPLLQLCTAGRTGRRV